MVRVTVNTVEAAAADLDAADAHGARQASRERAEAGVCAGRGSM
jgi:hypothetical protein